jgi:hypothetical protein
LDDPQENRSLSRLISTLCELEDALSARKVSITKLHRMPQTSNLWLVTIEEKGGGRTVHAEGLSLQEAISSGLEQVDDLCNENY